MANPKRSKIKPQKPSKTFPLTAHNNGQWCKKIRGKIHFFGVWNDPQSALESYLCIATDLHAGKQPRNEILSGDSALVKNVCNKYLTRQQNRVEINEISPRWFDDCRRTVTNFAKFVGSNRLVSDIRPTDFEKYHQTLLRTGLTGKPLGPHAMDRSVMIVKSLLAYAYDMDLIDKPVKFGNSFKRSTSASKRKKRSESQILHGKKLFTTDQARKIITSSIPPLKAMILLGLNGGFGNTDCARLPISSLLIDQSIIEFPRPKNGIDRTIPLWPETSEALQSVLNQRPEPITSEFANLLFLTKTGRPYVRHKVTHNLDGSIKMVSRTDAVGDQFDKLLISLDLKRKGLGFYALRHTFRTWADEVRDQHAIHRIMGHVIPGMSGIYVEQIGMDRLRAVVDHVRGKLFGEKAT